MTPATLAALVKGDIENAIIASTPGGIEAQEARGQQDLCRSSKLPRKMMYGCSKEVLERMGIVFEEIADDLFWNVTLPPGWKLQASDHSMWNSLLDDKGRKRASIFYKAAFYDRSSHIWLEARYSIESYHEDKLGVFEVVVKDCDTIIYSAGPYEDRDYPEQDRLKDLAKSWLKDHFPDYEDKTAYWLEGE